MVDRPEFLQWKPSWANHKLVLDLPVIASNFKLSM